MDKTKTANINETAPPTFTKRIGNTTYEVSVHFNPNARETLHKKMERIILAAAQNGGFV
jgi:hypothetical protein